MTFLTLERSFSSLIKLSGLREEQFSEQVEQLCVHSPIINAFHTVKFSDADIIVSFSPAVKLNKKAEIRGMKTEVEFILCQLYYVINFL